MRRPSPRRMARKRITIACRTSVSTRGTDVSRCIAKPPVWSAAKNRAATIAPTGSPTDEQRRHQSGPGVGRRQQRPVDEAELRAEHDDRADEAGDRAAREHGSYGLPPEPHAAVCRRSARSCPACATRSLRSSACRRSTTASAIAAMRRLPTLSGPDSTYEPRVRRDHEGLRQPGRNVAKGKARELGRDPDRRVAQEQARDQHRDAVPDLAPSRERGVEAAAERRERKSEPPRRARPAPEGPAATSAPIRPPMTSWPSPPRFTMPPRKRDGGGERHAHERRRPVERVGQGCGRRASL